MRMRKKKKTDRYKEEYAVGEFIDMSAHKVRRVIDQIRGRSYEETFLILELMPYRACSPILKLVSSAAANANHNRGFTKSKLKIIKAEVNEGTTVKKLKPRARGRGYPIKRPTCHIIICFSRSVNSRDIEEYPERHLGNRSDSISIRSV